MKYEHRIYCSIPNMFGLNYHYELIGNTHWAVGQIQQPMKTKLSLYHFRKIRKELINVLSASQN